MQRGVVSLGDRFAVDRHGSARLLRDRLPPTVSAAVQGPTPAAEDPPQAVAGSRQYVGLADLHMPSGPFDAWDHDLQARQAFIDRAQRFPEPTRFARLAVVDQVAVGVLEPNDFAGGVDHPADRTVIGID